MNANLGYWARKTLHLFANGTLAVLVLLVPLSLVKPLTVLGFIVILMFESIRLKTEAKKLVQETVGPMFKVEESIEYSGLFWIAVAALIIALFAQPLAISYGFAMLAVCDSFASAVGKLMAHRPFYRNKTLPGAITCFVAGFAITWLYIYVLGLPLPIYCSLGAAGIITLVEVFSFPFDDNFTIMIAAATLMHAVLTYL